ncbi:MAG: methyltransferase family protein [Acidimicrobiales bacterium]
MLVAVSHPATVRSALDILLAIWAAAEVALRIANHDTARDLDWTFPVLIGSIVAAINLGFQAAAVTGAGIGASPVLPAAGLVVVGAGAALRIWSILTLGRLFTFVVTVQADHRVVERGPYRLLRHPSYAGGLIGLIGAGVALDNWLSVAALGLIPLLGVLIRIPYEEARLRRGLGQPYVDYAAHTARLIPGLW